LHLMPVELRTRRSGKISPFFSQFLWRLGKRAYVFRRLILWASAAIAFLAAAGASLIHVDSNLIRYFKPTSEVRQANEVINQEIVAANPPFYLVLEGVEPDLFKRWEVLKQIKDLRSFLQTLPGTSSMSIVDGLELIGAGLNKYAESGMLDEQGNVLSEETRKFSWEDPKSLADPLKLVARRWKTFYVTEDF